ncbi:MAG: hypothetical protein WCO94_00360 [Verrucomicrobiota bacterium]
MKTAAIQILGIALIAFAISNGSARAGQVYLGVDSGDVTNANPAGVQTRYKISSTNWDAMIGNAVQPIVPASINAKDLGNNSALSGTPFSYEVTNLVGQGLYLSLKNLNTNYTTVLSYGNFASSPVASNFWQNATSLNGVFPQTTPYNALHLYAQASTVGDQVVYANASFTINTPGITLNGLLPASGSAQYGVNTTTQSYIAYFNDNGTKGDLSSIGWTFKSNVTVSRTTASGSGESAKFEFTGKTLDYTPPGGGVAAVPETSTWIMGFLALGAVVFMVRRNANSSV